MTIIKPATILAATVLLAPVPAFAQSAGTSGTGTSGGVQSTPGQPSASQPGNVDMPRSTGTQSGALGVSGGHDVPAPAGASVPAGH